LLGRNRHAAPVLSTHRMPSRQARFDAQGRPRLSLRRLGSGSSGSIKSHWSSVNHTNRFLLTQKAHQTARLSQQSVLRPNPFMKHALASGRNDDRPWSPLGA
jgi:hypothetical protein